jgi:hypothetical protein
MRSKNLLSRLRLVPRLSNICAGVFGPNMKRRTTYRLLAIVVAAVVLSFTFQAAGHWHNQSFEDQHCRICHFAHSVTVDFSHGTTLPTPHAMAWLNPTGSVDPRLELVFDQTSSRAPPAQS